MIARLVFWLLLALVALAPLPFGGNRPWAWSLMAAISGVLLALWATAATANPNLHALAWRHYRIVLGLLAGFLAWCFFQAAPFSPAEWHHASWTAAAAALGQPLAGAISVSPSDSLGGAMRFLSYAFVFWLAMQLGRRLERAQAAWWTVALAATGYAIYGLFEQFSGAPNILGIAKWAYPDSVSGTFVNRNHFAAYAGVGLILTVALIADQIKVSAREGLHSTNGIVYFIDHLRAGLFVLMLMFVVLVTALLLSHSRAGVLCTAIGILIMLLAFAASHGLRSRSLLVFGGIIVAVGLAVLIVSGRAVTSRMSELIENAEPRLQIYQLSLDAIAERPFLGTGLATFEHISRLMRGADFGPSEPTYDAAHNSYLELAVETGLPAALLLYGALIVLLLRFLRGARERRRAIIYPCSGLAVTALLAVHSLVDFSLQIPAIAVTYALIAGVAYSQSWRDEDLAAGQAKAAHRRD
ncbi:MAG TPA: O-antigen ligase family protein [Alphaproteobacteria bacterium]|nr:O-antigen ligase family protein [Alphaproteobacteria bacterium]